MPDRCARPTGPSPRALLARVGVPCLNCADAFLPCLLCRGDCVCVCACIVQQQRNTVNISNNEAEIKGIHESLKQLRADMSAMNTLIYKNKSEIAENTKQHGKLVVRASGVLLPYHRACGCPSIVRMQCSRSWSPLDFTRRPAVHCRAASSGCWNGWRSWRSSSGRVWGTSWRSSTRRSRK